MKTLRMLVERMDFPVTLAVAATAVAVTVAAWLGVESIFLLEARRSAVTHGELWRLATGPLLHSSWGMLLRDVATFVLMGAIYEPVLKKRHWVLLGAGVVIPAAAVVLLQPRFDAYYGLSGTVNALFVAAFIWEERAGKVPWWKRALFAGYLGKLLFEAVTGRLLFGLDLGADVAAAPVAHVTGALVGFLVMFPRWRFSATGDKTGPFKIFGQTPRLWFQKQRD